MCDGSYMPDVEGQRWRQAPYCIPCSRRHVLDAQLDDIHGCRPGVEKLSETATFKDWEPHEKGSEHFHLERIVLELNLASNTATTSEHPRAILGMRQMTDRRSTDVHIC